MVLVDTSVWIEHLRHGSDQLSDLLLNNRVYCHTFIIGELACGHFKNRNKILNLLNSLQKAVIADDMEVMQLIEEHHLYGQGLGWLDVHLLSSALLSGAQLWTMDKPLMKITGQLRIQYRG
jgi:predicted nucleic acid-binding protein